MDVLVFPLIILASLLLTEFIRRYSVKKDLLDIPNSRSSHSIPTPSGGGLSIVICFLIVIGFSTSLSTNTIFAFIGSGTLIAIVGFWDDRISISVRWRLLSHFIAAILALYWFGSLPEFEFMGLSINLSWFGFVIASFALVWLLNLFNFMDGIDGIAASEAVYVAFAGAYFSWLNGLESLSYISLILAASTMGFLILNWPPAKIFMGDVGSSFLGLMLGIIVYANILEGSSVWIWLILLGIFLVDSGVTLVRRVINGEKWYKAHCSHVYQHAARKWGHRKVTLAVIGANLFVLFPIALLVHHNPEWGGVITLFIFILLVAIAVKFKAGISVE